MASIHRPREHRQNRLQSKRLKNIVEGADFHGIDRSLNRALAGHHDRDQVRIDLHALSQQRNAIHARHHQVGKQHIKRLAAQSRKRFFA